MDSVSVLIHELGQLNSNEANFGELASSINQQIMETIDQVNHPDAAREFAKANMKEKLSLAISKDTVMIVLSWNTRLGGSSPEVNPILLHTNNDRVESFVLDEKSLRFSDIYKLDHKAEQSVYLLKGSGQSSSVEFYTSIYALTLHDGLKKADIFPEKQNTITISYPLDNTIDFVVSDDGIRILVPEKTYSIEDWGFFYRPMVLNGDGYQPEESQISFPVTADTFLGTKNFDHGFLKGAEIPIDTIKVANTTSHRLVFEDNTEVEHSYYPKEETTVIKISSNSNAKPLELTFDGYDARLLAKRNQFLFLELSGIPTSSPLLIYDIHKQRYVSSISQAGAKLTKGVLLFSQPISQNDEFKEKPKCDSLYGDQTRYFKTHILDYKADYPTVMPTGQLYCGFSE
ncbi:hypothetical protein PY092_14460 [Muricauda sp. 334s03]|uniref:Uncharacterized protein n=1 Tax=Flagellimonas yonaguniensis TaxID=3031325 RepID=A0ABT5Y1P3_9FLAO|nr:hypothetical protein [[Muricauda] yonaguniensis]MDF0717363.1 hypothetical protein [[Muricauda] yonaguniensis]